VDFGLLGPLLVADGTRPVVVSAPRQRVLLATLLLSAGRVVGADALAETLWDGRPPAGARGALHTGVQRLRSTLGPAGAGLIVTRPPGMCCNSADGLGHALEGALAQAGVLAAVGQRRRRVGCVDLTGEPVPVEDRLRQHPRRDRVADPVHRADPGRRQGRRVAG